MGDQVKDWVKRCLQRIKLAGGHRTPHLETDGPSAASPKANGCGSDRFYICPWTVHQKQQARRVQAHSCNCGPTHPHMCFSRTKQRSRSRQHASSVSDGSHFFRNRRSLSVMEARTSPRICSMASQRLEVSSIISRPRTHNGRTEGRAA